MSRFEELLLPRRLPRIRYVIRILILDVCLWLLLAPSVPRDPALGGLRFVALVIGSLAVAVYGIMFVLLPRLRDAGWSSWLVLAALLPYIGVVLQLILVFVPSRRDLVDEPI